MPDEQPDSQVWYKSGQIRVALTLFVPIFVRIAQHTPIGKWMAAYLGIDILTIPSDQIVGWLMAAIAAIGGVLWIRKRVQVGKDPQSCAPEIIPPRIVQRLTGKTPVVREPVVKDEHAIDPTTKAREEIDELAEMIRQDEKFRERLNHTGTAPKEGGK